jgi:hypothetical protein
VSRGAKGVGGRRVGGRPTYPTFLIVCEGAKTEPQYFEGFKLPSALVVGAGKNTKSLVEEAIRLKERSEPRDHYWCVFDRDSFSAQNFNAALQLARSAGFEVAYSNEAFELWYLLHFSYSEAALARRLYAEKLTKLLGRPYQKNDPTIYETLLPRQEDAIKHARRLLVSYEPHHNPEKDNPSTRVHVLVELLRAAQRR